MRLLIPFLGYRLLGLYDILVLALLRLTFGRPYVGTRSGRHVPLLDPKPHHIRTKDLTHALAFTCRYGGHVRQHYSVAQHSYHVGRLCAFPQEGALHDAPEAYLGDVVSPLKPLLWPIYGVLERGFDKAIGIRYGLCPRPHYAPWRHFAASRIVWGAVKKADHDVYLWEASHLIPCCLPPNWKGKTYARPPTAWQPHAARAHFTRHLQEIGIQ